MVLHYVKLTNPLSFQIWFPKSGPKYRKQVVNPQHQTPQGQLVSLELPVEYLSRESKHDMKESKVNMFNPVFKRKVQGWTHRERCVFAEPELLSQKSKHTVKKKRMVIKIPIIVTTIMMK